MTNTVTASFIHVAQIHTKFDKYDMLPYIYP